MVEPLILKLGKVTPRSVSLSEAEAVPRAEPRGVEVLTTNGKNLLCSLCLPIGSVFPWRERPFVFFVTSLKRLSSNLYLLNKIAPC